MGLVIVMQSALKNDRRLGPTLRREMMKCQDKIANDNVIVEHFRDEQFSRNVETVVKYWHAMT